MSSLSDSTPPESGLTLRAALLGVLCSAVLGWVLNTAMGAHGYGMTLGTEVLSVPALFLLFLLVLWGGIFRIHRPRLALSRAEGVCVAYIMLISAPMMTLSFWVPVFSMISPHSSRENWHAYDTLPQKLRPEGPNLLSDRLHADDPRLNVSAGGVSFSESPLLDHTRGRTVVLTGTDTGSDGPSARIKLPLRLVEDGLYFNAYYVFSGLFRVRDAEPGSTWSVRLHSDGPESPMIELVRGRGPTDPNPLSRGGFMRKGRYAFRIPEGARDSLQLEFRLEGPGTLEIGDVELRDVTAFALTKTGAPVISRPDYEALPPAYRAGMVVRPDHLLSWSGLRYFLTGSVMWGAWLRPLGWWLAFLLFLFGGAFALGLIMRRQWMDRERFPLPLTMPLIDVLGRPKNADGDSGKARRFPPLFYSPFFRAGFLLALLWGLHGLASAYFGNIGEVSGGVSLSTYLNSPEWGKTWSGVRLNFFPFVFGIGLLLELNVLISLVVGYLAFRLQYFIGHKTGWDTDGGFPHSRDQGKGSFLFYGLTLTVLAGNYLRGTLRKAIRNEPRDGELVSYRTAWGLLGVCAAGLFVWARGLGSSSAGALILVGTGYGLTLVFMKLRTECGVPGNTLFAGRIALYVPVIGGLGAVGPAAFGLNAELGRMMSMFSILVIAGLQLEFLQMARMYGIKRRHVPMTLVLGLLCGVFIGGWFMLSGSYATGTENWTHSTLVDPAHTNVRTVLGELNRVSIEMAVDTEPAGVRPDTIAFFGAGAVAVALTVLRQVFAGFWFHPIGFLLGPSAAVSGAWGSLLLAWLFRLLALRLGGAATVREKVRPFATGILMGTVVSVGVAVLVNFLAWVTSPGIELFQLNVSPR